jgi:hypothetical protein
MRMKRSYLPVLVVTLAVNRVRCTAWQMFDGACMQNWKKCAQLVTLAVVGVGCDSTVVPHDAPGASAGSGTSLSPESPLRDDPAAAPPDAAFLRMSRFALPLVPLGETTPDENRAFAAALSAYDADVAQTDERDSKALARSTRRCSVDRCNASRSP